MTLVDDPYNDPFFASIYDEQNPWSASDDFYLAKAREIGGSILDLGCGTGMLACRIAAEGLSVVGVDPAAAMLQVARSRPGSDRVMWFHAGGQSMRLSQRFDLIYMTGHAFQQVLSDAEIMALLKNVAGHLQPSGRFIFETRNPAHEAWRSWTPERTRAVAQTSAYGPIEWTYDAVADAVTGVVDLTERCRLLDTGEERIGRSRLRFVNVERLTGLLRQSGLAPRAWYGDWAGGPFLPMSAEIIVEAGRAD
jgi:SAM-dependent methyltransferase